MVAAIKLLTRGDKQQNIVKEVRTTKTTSNSKSKEMVEATGIIGGTKTPTMNNAKVARAPEIIEALPMPKIKLRNMW